MKNETVESVSYTAVHEVQSEVRLETETIQRQRSLDSVRLFQT